jgi:adenylate cyclase class 2
MAAELEATFVNISHEDLRHRLKKAGATLVQPMTLMRRIIFDYPNMRLDNQTAWLRLRDEGDKVMLTYKQRLSSTLDGMKEIETEVSSFEQTAELLKAIGMIIKASQETKREVWTMSGCQITLDDWPWIPPFTEIEGQTETAVKAACEQLNFSWGEAIFDSIDAIYLQHFDVTRTEISSADIRFGVVPEWLEAKRIKR